jgi:hypothetical protein
MKAVNHRIDVKLYNCNNRAVTGKVAANSDFKLLIEFIF